MLIIKFYLQSQLDKMKILLCQCLKWRGSAYLRKTAFKILAFTRTQTSMPIDFMQLFKAPIRLLNVKVIQPLESREELVESG